MNKREQKDDGPLVYVISKSGKPLMPTRHCGKVGWLLRHDKAKVVKREPFTIQLLYETPEKVQPVTLGIDPGYENIGVSASTEKEELYAAEAEIRTDVSRRLFERRNLRRTRRTRKVRHRKPRFNNRKSSKPKGWLPPTFTQKIQAHLNEIGFVCSILPVSKIVVESAAFDIQKIKNPDISGVDYQNGPLKGFSHVREYVLYRDNHECQVCHGRSGCKILHLHHLNEKPEGTDTPDNLTTVCGVCHPLIHHGEVEAPKEVFKRTFKAETAMNIMRYKLVERIKEEFDVEVETTYGADTKSKRIYKGYVKSHAIDALMISGNIEARPVETLYRRRQRRAHNRQIHRTKFNKGGIRRRAQTDYEMFGFKLFDKVLYEGREVLVTSRRSNGRFKVATFDKSFSKDGISYKKLKLVQRAKRTLVASEKRGLKDIIKPEADLQAG